jgi:4-hydroxybenzoate polyprenyltransferase
MSLRKTLTAWGRLLRLPNLLTVPGDPLVGFVIVAGVGFSWSSPALWASMGASVLLYAAGLIHNDLCDLDEDRRERPNRPLACGAISKRSAIAVMILLVAEAMGVIVVASGAHCAIPLLVCVLLASAILAYNALLKRWVVPGAIAMGFCRGLSFLLGGVIALPYASQEASRNPILIFCFMSVFILIWVSYIAGVTILASRETKPQRLGASRYLPGAPLTLILGLLVAALVTSVFDRFEDITSMQTDDILPLLWTQRWRLLWPAIWMIATINAASPIWKLRGIAQPADIQRMIGRLIRNLLLIQAAMLFWAEQWQAGIVFLILHPIHARLARWFYAS